MTSGAIASRHIAAQCGFPNSIGLDMGGTSCDVSLAYEGQSRVTKDWHIEFGYPIRFPSIEVLTIGAGGGSLAGNATVWDLKDGGTVRSLRLSSDSNFALAFAPDERMRLTPEATLSPLIVIPDATASSNLRR